MASFKDWNHDYLSRLLKEAEKRVENRRVVMNGLRTSIKTWIESPKTFINGLEKETCIKNAQKQLRLENDKLQKEKLVLKNLLEKLADGSTKDLAHLKSHPMVEKISVDEKGYLNIILKPIKSSVPGKAVHPIGSFRLAFKPASYLYVFNLTYQAEHLDHWAINENHCCFGEWSDGIWTYLKGGEIYMFIDLMVRYISGSGDSAAYCSFATWIEKKVKISKSDSTKKESGHLTNQGRQLEGSQDPTPYSTSERPEPEFYEERLSKIDEVFAGLTTLMKISDVRFNVSEPEGKKMVKTIKGVKSNGDPILVDQEVPF